MIGLWKGMDLGFGRLLRFGLYATLQNVGSSGLDKVIGFKYNEIIIV